MPKYPFWSVSYFKIIYLTVFPSNWRDLSWLSLRLLSRFWVQAATEGQVVGHWLVARGPWPQWRPPGIDSTSYAYLVPLSVTIIWPLITLGELKSVIGKVTKNQCCHYLWPSVTEPFHSLLLGAFGSSAWVRFSWRNSMRIENPTMPPQSAYSTHLRILTVHASVDLQTRLQKVGTPAKWVSMRL